MQSRPGTYILVLQGRQHAEIEIGRWGRLCLEPGYFLYIGSAFGPGGIRARVSRHYRSEKTKRWHIDYLREFAEPVIVWFSHDPERLEHRWAQAIAQMPGMVPVNGFGSSDCRCRSHLFFSTIEPEPDRFRRFAGSDVGLWDCHSTIPVATPAR